MNIRDSLLNKFAIESEQEFITRLVSVFDANYPSGDPDLLHELILNEVLIMLGAELNENNKS